MIEEYLRQRIARVNFVRNTIIILKSLISIISANLRDSRRSNRSLICNDDQDLFEDMNTRLSHTNSSPNSLNDQISEEVNETLAQLEYGNGRHQHVLSFSNDKAVVIVDDESDYVLCKDVVQNVYNIINTIMLFFKVGMLDRIDLSSLLHRILSTHIS